MKILRLVALLVSVALLCSACVAPASQTTEATSETVAAWITYSEIDALVGSAAGFEAEFTAAIKRLKEIGVNTVYFHTIAFCDAVYESRIYPKRHETDIDILDSAVEICKENDVSLHAWINPYRVQTASNDPTTLKNSFVTEWLSDKQGVNYSAICFTDSGIYLNPASAASRSKVIAAIREIVQNYAVSGIQFDDYFYPTVSADFDKAAYDAYLAESESPLSLEHWRRMNVNSLILGVYTAVKAADSRLLFGISPAADLDRCYNTLFADVETWVNGGYIDYILPQLYFGFEYPNERFRFENLVVKWLSITEGSSVELLAGLPMYKSGTDSSPDNAEWQADNTIVARQIECVRQYDISGFAFFSYSSLFSEDAANAEQLKNIKEVLK